MRRWIGVLMLLALVQVAMAQKMDDGLKQVQEEIDTLQFGKQSMGISRKEKDATLKKISKKYAKNAEVQRMIAKSYYAFFYDNYNDGRVSLRKVVYLNRDTLNAFRYIDKALSANKKFTPAYLFAASICQAEDQHERALAWCDKAIKVCPQDTAGYLKRAELMALDDVNEAVAYVENLRNEGMVSDADLHIARLYVEHYKDETGITREQMREVVGYYDKAQRENMNETDVSNYAVYLSRCASSEQEHEVMVDKAIDVAEWGIRKYPKDFGLHYFLMNLYYSKHRYQEALKEHELMMQADNVQIRPEDFFTLGKLYNDMGRYREALAAFEKVQQWPEVSEEYKTNAEANISMVIQKMALQEGKQSGYEQALKEYETFLNGRRQEGKLTASMLDTHAKLYMQMAEGKDSVERQRTLAVADSIYGEMVERFPDQDIYGAYQRWQLHSLMDPQNELGLAVPYAEKVVEVIKGKDEELTANRKSQLVNAYWTLCYFAAISEPVDMERVKETGQEILALSPDHPGVSQIFKILHIEL